MRTFILVFMMLLLPVRGWSGDMMAIEMTGMVSATQKIAAHDLNTGASALLAHQKQGRIQPPSATDGSLSCLAQ